MKEFKNDNEKRDFLLVVISRYRIFLMKWLNVTRLEFIEIMSRRLNKDVAMCHLSALDLAGAIEMIQELKKFKWELTGSRNLNKKVNPREYAIKIKNKVNNLKEEN